jgi:hypothetical protein
MTSLRGLGWPGDASPRAPFPSPVGGFMARGVSDYRVSDYRVSAARAAVVVRRTGSLGWPPESAPPAGTGQHGLAPGTGDVTATLVPLVNATTDLHASPAGSSERVRQALTMAVSRETRPNDGAHDSQQQHLPPPHPG